jgi:hypothetical protein
MTLKEKFIDAFKSGKRFDIKNAEVIADEFAIGFGEWCLNSLLNGEEPQGETMEELLEMYKKEQGL